MFLYGLLLIWSYRVKLKSHNNLISKAKDELAEVEKMRANNRDKYNKDIRLFDAQIARIIIDNTESERKITECKKYLAHGKNKMVEMFFALRCKSIGVDQQFDVTTKLLRELAMGSYNFHCKSCGSNSITDLEVFTSEEYVCCPSCGALVIIRYNFDS